MLTESHILALEYVSHLLHNAQDDWWVIGSAAIALHGVDVGPVNDIDILVSLRDAQALRLATGTANRAVTGSKKFRSEVFLQLDYDGIPLEVMANFSVNHQGRWQAILPTSRQAFNLGNACVYAPALRELVEILRVFSREKDRQRIRFIDQSLGGLPADSCRGLAAAKSRTRF